MQVVNRVVLVHTHGALIDTHAPQRQRALGFAEDQRRLNDQTFGNTANLLGHARRVIFDGTDERAKSICCPTNSRSIRLRRAARKACY
jgi:hypothetical protein